MPEELRRQVALPDGDRGGSLALGLDVEGTALVAAVLAVVSPRTRLPITSLVPDAPCTAMPAHTL